MDLNGLGIELEAIDLVDKEFLNVLALVTLELNHLAHLTVVNGGAIASCVNNGTRLARLVNQLEGIQGWSRLVDMWYGYGMVTTYQTSS